MSLTEFSAFDEFQPDALPLPVPKYLDKDRYRITDSGKVYDTWGRYYIETALWNRRIRENRSSKVNHDFVLGERVEEDIEDQWHRVHAVCNRCGEKRQVFFGVNLRDLNSEWCVRKPTIKKKSWWRHLFSKESL